MSKRGLGLVLVLMFAAAIAAGTAFQDFRFDISSAQDDASAERSTRTLQSAELALAELRAAQTAYVAEGQGAEFWLKRAADLSSRIETGLSELQSRSASPEARTHYDSALSALGALNTLDQKARDDLANGDRALAADVIFKDATSTADQLAAELTSAGWAEAAARNARLADVRRRRLATTAGGLALLFILVTVFAARRRAATPVEPAAGGALGIASGPAPAAAVVPAAAPAAGVNLAQAAEVCIDFARVLDGQDVPPLLKRAAEVIEAKGLVLWVADQSGATLRPSLSHGYSDKVLQRLGPLQVAADNVTSLAFRSMRAQTLGAPGKGGANAFAVPLIASTGCIGVLSAEIADQAAIADKLAIARIFAAQLATLVSPAAAAGAQAAQS